MNINKLVLDEIRNDIRSLADVIKSNKEKRWIAREELKRLVGLRAQNLKDGKPVPVNSVQNQIDAECTKISNTSLSIKELSKRVTMLHAALAYAHAKQHRSPNSDESLLLTSTITKNFTEVYDWYEFWVDNRGPT